MLEWVKWDLVDCEIARLGHREKLTKRIKAMVVTIVELPGIKALQLADLFQLGLDLEGKRSECSRIHLVHTNLRPLVDAGVLELRHLPRFVYGNPEYQSKPLNRIVQGKDAYYLIGELVLRPGYPSELRELPFEVDKRGRVDRYKKPKRRKGVYRASVRKVAKKKQEADAMAWAASLRKTK